MEVNVDKSPMFELRILRSENSEEFTKISFYKNRGFRDWEKYDGWEVNKRLNASDSIVSIDTSYSSSDPNVLSRPPESAPVYIKENENLFLRVFIDKSVVEVFVNERQCLATRIYPSKKDSLGVSVLSQGAKSEIISLDAYDMDSIYDD